MMLRKQEKKDDLQDIRNQIKELRDEFRHLKKSIKKDSSKIFSDSFMPKQFNIMNSSKETLGSSSYNNSLIKEFTKIFSHSINIPNSFSD